MNNQQISLTAKQQAIAIEQVMEAMNNFNQGAIQTASGISETKFGGSYHYHVKINVSKYIFTK